MENRNPQIRGILFQGTDWFVNIASFVCLMFKLISKVVSRQYGASVAAYMDWTSISKLTLLFPSKT